jgi:hypothetical protein
MLIKGRKHGLSIHDFWIGWNFLQELQKHTCKARVLNFGGSSQNSLFFLEAEGTKRPCIDGRSVQLIIKGANINGEEHREGHQTALGQKGIIKHPQAC